MSNYTKATNFTAKDSLTTGDPSKKILGSEIDTEYTAIETAIATKADTVSPTFTGTVTLPTVAGNRTDSGNVAHSGTVTMSAKSMYWVKGADIASANPLVIGSDGNYFDVTGTTGFASMTVTAGMLFMLQFDGALTLTHHATNLNLPSGANITTAAGDRMICFATAANTVHVLNYTRASGKAVVTTTTASDITATTNTPLGAATTSFSSLTAGSRYRIVYNFTISDINTLRLRFNSDSNARYSQTGYSANSGAAPSGLFGTGQAYIQLDPTTGAANDQLQGWIEFQTLEGDTTFANVDFSSSRSTDNSPNFGEARGHGRYGGGATDITSVTIYPGTGTITGTAVLFEIPG